MHSALPAGVSGETPDGHLTRNICAKMRNASRVYMAPNGANPEAWFVSRSLQYLECPPYGVTTREDSVGLPTDMSAIAFERRWKLWATGAKDYPRCRFENARPEPDFRYRSNAIAFCLSVNPIMDSIRQGLNLPVCGHAPWLCSFKRCRGLSVTPVYVLPGLI